MKDRKEEKRQGKEWKSEEKEEKIEGTSKRVNYQIVSSHQAFI